MWLVLIVPPHVVPSKPKQRASFPSTYYNASTLSTHVSMEVTKTIDIVDIYV